jgi:hypothetical protein
MTPMLESLVGKYDSQPKRLVFDENMILAQESDFIYCVKGFSTRILRPKI